MVQWYTNIFNDMTHLYHGVKIDLDLWLWKLGHQMLKTHNQAYLRNQWSNCFHIWYAYRLWRPTSKCAILTSVWPSMSKIGRGQNVGQREKFSNRGLWHTKPTRMMSRMQNCYPFWNCVMYNGKNSHFVLFQCDSMGLLSSYGTRSM